MGPSYGGNISALISYNHPDVFGLCGVHSGAFQPNNYEAFTLITTGDFKDIKWSSIWGSYESLSQNMQDFRDSLLSKGYELDWLELPEGHSWGLWRATIDNMLQYFFPSTATGIEINKLKVPEGFDLYQNYPNPFNPSTTMSFTISDTHSTNLKVYDILGNEIAILVDEEKTAGNYSVVFVAEQLSSGVYFYELQSGDYVKTKKMLLLK
jgi:enterochelin esterase family protein